MIIQLFAKSCADTTLEDAVETINSLVLTNKALEELINDPEVNLKLIKSRAKKFNVSDATVAKALKTKASRKRLVLQLQFKKIIKELDELENNNILPRMNALLEKGVNVDFTYRWDKESKEYLSPLMRAAEDGSKFLIKYLLEHGADINQSGFNGKTALMYAEDPAIIEFLTKDRPSLNINQQDNAGNTALLRILQHHLSEDEENKENNIAMVQELINAGANAEIGNNNKLTPLQAAQDSGDEEMIKIIQDAIAKTDKIEEEL
jgi:ankyrin repeat protein